MPSLVRGISKITITKRFLSTRQHRETIDVRLHMPVVIRSGKLSYQANYLPDAFSSRRSVSVDTIWWHPCETRLSLIDGNVRKNETSASRRRPLVSDRPKVNYYWSKTSISQDLRQSFSPSLFVLVNDWSHKIFALNNDHNCTWRAVYRPDASMQCHERDSDESFPYMVYVLVVFSSWELFSHLLFYKTLLCILSSSFATNEIHTADASLLIHPARSIAWHRISSRPGKMLIEAVKYWLLQEIQSKLRDTRQKKLHPLLARRSSGPIGRLRQVQPVSMHKAIFWTLYTIVNSMTCLWPVMQFNG